MNNLLVTIPGFGEITNPIPSAEARGLTNIGGFLSNLYTVALYIAGFLAFYWLIWGVYQYIIARGNKEGLAKARSRIIWAIVGLLIVILAYTLARFATEIFQPFLKGDKPYEIPI